MLANSDFDYYELARDADSDIDDDDNTELEKPQKTYIDQNVPKPEKWYHGSIERKDAENRLLAKNEPNSYLVRESHMKSGVNYSLSYLSTPNSVPIHFRITAICGDFYIGGRKFQSLQHLIGYYSTYGSLVKNETLKTPIGSPEPITLAYRVIAKFPFKGTLDTDELSFDIGDVFSVQNVLDEDWLWAVAQKDNKSGLIPEKLTEKMHVSADPFEGQSWFSSVTKQDVQTILMNYGDVGNFLIRPSENQGDYSISLRCGNNVTRFRIQRKGEYFMIGGRQFDSMESIIKRYKKEQLAEGVSLTEPLKREKYESFFLNLNRASLYDSTDGASPNVPKVAPLRANSHVSSGSVFAKKGYLIIRGNRNKKWKKYFAVLKEEEQQLLYFENEKRAKPKGLYDLTLTTVYHVHESLFGRPNCFQIVIRAYNEKQTYYICTETSDIKQEWFDSISQYCNKMNQSKQSTNGVKELRSLELNICHAQKIPVNKLQHPYCIVMLNDINIGRTKSQEAPEPVFEEEFKFNDLPNEITSFTITMYNHKGGLNKDKEMARVTVNLNTLEPGKTLDQWFVLGSLQSKSDMGSIRLTAKFVHEVIMPVEVYRKLQDMFLDDKDYQMVQALGEVVKDLNSLAYTLLRIFRQEGNEINLITAITSRELNTKQKKETLFRGNTLASKLMDQYMKMTAIPYLQRTIKDVISKIMECKQCCELNPARVEKGSDVAENLQQLIRFLEEITSSIFGSTNWCPRSLRYLFHCLRKEAKKVWTDEPYIDSRVVSAFLFLRLIVPAVLNPKSYNLITESPSQIASRTLTLVAMCLQKLANLVEFGAKEPYLVVVNPFLQKYRTKMVDFIEEMANQPESITTNEINKHDIARDLAAIHEKCVRHEHNLMELCSSQPKVKILLPIIEGIKRQKEQYTRQSGTNCDEFAI